jgi:hypothetical protein
MRGGRRSHSSLLVRLAIFLSQTDGGGLVVHGKYTKNSAVGSLYDYAACSVAVRTVDGVGLQSIRLPTRLMISHRSKPSAHSRAWRHSHTGHRSGPSRSRLACILNPSYSHTLRLILWGQERASQTRKLTKVGFAKDADWLARLYEPLSLRCLVLCQTLNVLVAYD